MDLPTDFSAMRGRLLADAGLFPHQVDVLGERVLFTRLTQADYRSASFLDQRVLSPSSQAFWLSFAQLEALLRDARPALPLHFIFHAGHVGSTLISRLLEDMGGVLALREPLALRALAEASDVAAEPHALMSPAQIEQVVGQLCTLWARGFADTRTVVLKATSSAGRIAPLLLDRAPGARAIWLSLAAEPYLATLLAGENSRVDLRGFAAERMRRIVRAGVMPEAPLHAMSIGEVAALAWLAERLAQETGLAAAPGRVLPVDFDAFLSDVGGALRGIAAHLGLQPSEAQLAAAPDSPTMRRYAKAPEHAYSPQLRAEVLAEARALHGSEIGRGRAWLERLGARFATVAGILSSSTSAG